MKTNPIFPLTLLYDGRCAVCSLEMDHLRARDREVRLAFVDIAASGFDAAAFHATPEQLDAEIHAIGADGTLLRGVAVLRLAYEAVGLGWVFAPSDWPGLRRLSEAAYRAFARHRRPISAAAAPLIDALRALRARRTAQRMRDCHDGRCDIPGRPS